MKNLAFLAQRIFPLAALLFCTLTSLQAQVTTRYLENPDELKTYLPWIFEDAPAAHQAPTPAAATAVVIDLNTEPQFIATPLPLMLTEADGKFYEFDSYTVWKMEVTASGAQSINLILDNVVLPERSQLIIYSKKTAMFHGPVVSKELVEGKYFSDFIIGDQAIIEVVMPTAERDVFQLSITEYLFGTQNMTDRLRYTPVVNLVVSKSQP